MEQYLGCFFFMVPPTKRNRGVCAGVFGTPRETALIDFSVS